MRLLRFGASALSCSLLLSLLSVFFFVGCNRPAPEEEDVEPVEKAPAKVPLTPMESSGKGSLTGRVTLSGNLPDLAALDSDMEKMIKGNNNSKECNAYKQQKWVLGKDNGLGNVVVMLRPEKNKYFPFDPADLTEAMKKNVTVDQPGCAFTNHVVVVFPRYPDPKDPKNYKAGIPTGQKLEVLNSQGDVPHTFRFDETTRNKGFDRGSGLRQSLEIDLFPDSSPLIASCGTHPWMSCCIWVVDNPYYAITDKDGNYSMKNVPAGKCRIVFWHEVLGYQNADGFKGEPIELKVGSNDKDFQFKMK